MQKKIIALAVAGLVSGAAFAQSNVTVYGVVDTAFVNSSGGRPTGINAGQANYSAIDSGLLAGSRIGFKGEEGLGNGLKAVFTLEYYVAPDANTGVGTGPTATAAGGSGSNSRQSFVGLVSDKLGSFTMGRQYIFGYGTQVRNDAFGGSAIGALATANGAAQTTFVAGSNARLNNSAVYTSPNFSGFTGTVGYGYGEVS
jgi:predicted porin